jgi:hypothetical protein
MPPLVRPIDLQMMNDISSCPDELDHGFESSLCLQYNKRDFCRGKHHLEADKMHYFLAWMPSPPDPLSAMEQSDSRKPYAERGKEIEKGGSLGEPPFSKSTSPSPMAYKQHWGVRMSESSSRNKKEVHEQA